MKKASKIVAAIVVLAFVGGAVFLMTWDIPVPSARVEKTLPDDRFPQ